MPEAEAQVVESRFDAAATARRILRTARHGALGTLTEDGLPFTSLVAVATAPSGAPLLLISRLAVHTGNLTRDGRASLLLGEAGDDPLAAARLTITGNFAPVVDPGETEETRRRFLARHPSAAGYAGFADFGFWRMVPETAHLVAGFGRITEVAAGRFMTDLAGAGQLVAAAAGAVDHMNEDHLDALALYAERLCGAGPGEWITTGADPDGIDLMTRDGSRTARLDFPDRVTTTGDLRGQLVRLAHAARAAG